MISIVMCDGRISSEEYSNRQWSNGKEESAMTNEGGTGNITEKKPALRSVTVRLVSLLKMMAKPGKITGGYTGFHEYGGLREAYWTS